MVFDHESEGGGYTHNWEINLKKDWFPVFTESHSDGSDQEWEKQQILKGVSIPAQQVCPISNHTVQYEYDQSLANAKEWWIVFANW